ncbi:hypothetical protein R3P38DRAFT_2530048 [Favolaschia claudopus]|uniref:NAD(P)-binding protein n=1 Tax=Favolaschia claudopus TaxID=2862362 RepID=A0AAW0BGC0_9AGAR
MNWGSQGIDSFISPTHSSIYPSIDPGSVTLPNGFTICIFGASGAIGAGIAYAYAKAGAANIILASRRVEKLGEVAAKCATLRQGVNAEVVQCDIAKIEDVKAIAEKVNSQFGGRLDCVVVCSGISGPVTLDITQGDPEIFKQVTDVNYFGTYLVAHYFIPLLLASSSSQAKSFLAVGSIAALIVRGPIANAQYCVSKTAQLKLVEHIHEQQVQHGLLATSIHPGAVASEQAIDTAPEVFQPYLTDDPELCGAACVWLSKDATEKTWLGGRLLNARWDVDELVKRRTEIVEKDLLKAKLSLQ